MSNDLLSLYSQIRETPALTVDFPEETGKGCVTRLDTNAFSLSTWNMEFFQDTYVEGNVPKDMRLLFCTGEGVEWDSGRGPMRLEHNEACFCLSDGSAERMCYRGCAPFSFFSVAVPMERFAGMIGQYLPDPDRIMEILPGRRFAISAGIRKSLHEIGPLGSVHAGFGMMQLDARLQESLSLCLQAALCEPAGKRRLHREDLEAIRTVGERIGEDPAAVPDIAALAREYCMSVSKLTRTFRQVYGVPLHAYVIEARLQKGAELLNRDGITIGEIAEMLGYTKPSQFSADFRKRYGILPGEYRSCG